MSRASAARVRAYHTHGEGPFGPTAGVYASSADPVTAVHELVHARVAAIDPHRPLWFEEGLACVLGDGYRDGDRWGLDGLACWPLRELRQRAPDATELARLLAMRADQGTDLRENARMHFVGWAIVFDLYRAEGRIDWSAWAQRARSMSVAKTRERMLRTLSAETESSWLARLHDHDRGVRMATGKGPWKLRPESRPTSAARASRTSLGRGHTLAVPIPPLAVGLTRERRHTPAHARAGADETRIQVPAGERDRSAALAPTRPLTNAPRSARVLWKVRVGTCSSPETRRERMQPSLSVSHQQPPEEHAVERLAMPSGDSIRLTCEPDRPPVLAALIQKLFASAESPSVACGRVRVVVQLLAPNERPQQVTDDLANRMVDRRPRSAQGPAHALPAHSWPEVPWIVQPER